MPELLAGMRVVIARVFRELGLMEEWGSGYRRVTDSCTRAGYPVPEWQEVGPSLRVTIFPHPEAREQLINNPVNVPVIKGRHGS